MPHMNHSKFPITILAIFTILICIIILPATAAASIDITDSFSNTRLTDVTIDSDADIPDATITFTMSEDGKKIQKKILHAPITIGEQTFVTPWDTKLSEGSYDMDISVFDTTAELANTSYFFSHYFQAYPKFRVIDVYADSTYVSVFINPYESSVADVEFMLVDNGKVVYTQTEDNVVLSQATEISSLWNFLPEEGKEYLAYTKIKTHRIHDTPGDTIAYLDAFIPEMDVSITDTFSNEKGASITLVGESRIPFAGDIEFDVYEDGTLIRHTKERGPIVIFGDAELDEEAVEAMWDEPLSEGRYLLRISAINDAGRIVEFFETFIVVEAAKISDTTISEENVEKATEKTPGFGWITSILALVSITTYMLVRRGEADV